MQRTIRATGRGNMTIAPDTTRITITVEKIYSDYETTVKKSAEHTGQLREVIAQAGLDSKDLKTTRFNINSEYEGYRDDNDDWRQRFVGYKYDHAMSLEFPIDNEVLGKVLYQLMLCPVKTEFNIGYTVRNADAVRADLLSKAVERAKADAEVIAKAAGVKLGEIITMDHSWSQMEIYSDVMRMNEPLMGSADCVREESLSYDIEPDDIHLDDTVTVVWEIA